MVNSKTDWQQQTHRRAAIVFDQLAVAVKSAPTKEAADEFLAAAGNPFWTMLDRLYGEDYALARLIDGSDLVVHAEGPAAADAAPQLRAVNWLCHGVDSNLRSLARAVLAIAGRDANRLAKLLDLRLTGLAPGSLYAGFALAPSDADMLDGILTGDQEPVFLAVRDAIRGLPIVPQYIGDDRVSEGIFDAMPDAAVRDASLTAVFRLAPTGKMGIHTIEIGAPEHKAASISQRERVVLRESLARPSLRGQKHGEFVGEVREIDLDARRFHVRNIPGVGTIRCAWEGDMHTVQNVLGEGVRIEGNYETDRNGKPRMMIVETISPYGKQTSLIPAL